MKNKLLRTGYFNIGILSLSHFIVDLSCTMLLTLTAARSYSFGISVVEMALLYNGLAFAFQLFVGAVADIFDFREYLASFGILCVCIAFYFENPIIICIISGIGNAFFHIGAARNVLISYNRSFSSIGIFVAPGAIGIFLGPLLTEFYYITQVFIPAILIIFAVICILLNSGDKRITKPTLKRKWIPLLAFFITVLLRSYIGTLLKYDFMSNFFASFIFTFSIFSGKLFGGIIAQRFGVLCSHIIIQPLTVILLLLSPIYPIFAFPAIMLFNTSMPATAACLYRNFSDFPGTMFGITTLALYIGSIPSLLKITVLDPDPAIIFILSLISAVFLLIGIKYSEGKDDKC